MASKRFKCPVCEFTCGRNKAFEAHLAEHGFTSTESAYVATQLNGSWPRCACNSCNETPAFWGWNQGFASYVDGHSGRIYSSLGEEKAKQVAEKRARKLRGRPGWSRGLTKETSDALKRAAETRSETMSELFSSGKLTPWSKGRTKDTDARLAARSQQLKEKFATGEIEPWSKGLTKETDERVWKMSLSVSRAHRQKELRGRLDAIKRLDPEVISQRLSENVEQLELITDLESYTRDRHVNLDFRCKTCGSIQQKSLIQALSDRCDFCTPVGSKGQRELYSFAQTLDPTCRANDRSIIAPLEMDVVMPTYKLGVEFNGLYFHSEIFKSKRYHDEKSASVAAAGWRLMHVWEDEWRHKQPIVESMIRHRCGLNPSHTSARKCVIRLLSPDERREFFESNHIDGDARASKAWGLYDQNRDMVVAAVSVRKPMHKKWSGCLEIARLATLTGEAIPGAVSKLLGAAENHTRSQGFGAVITYADSRFGSYETAGYEKVGYRLLGRTPPRFWWTDGSSRIDRFKVRADKDAGLSEKQVADGLGVVKVWGCRNLLYKKPIA